jgi:molybdopterin converting factor small subunit
MSVRVLIGSPLRSYTRGADEVRGEGESVGAVLRDLDQRFSGIAFRVIDEQGRVRTHMRVCVAGDMARRETDPVPGNCEVLIVGALSGG